MCQGKAGKIMDNAGHVKYHVCVYKSVDGLIRRKGIKAGWALKHCNLNDLVVDDDYTPCQCCVLGNELDLHSADDSYCGRYVDLCCK